MEKKPHQKFESLVLSILRANTPEARSQIRLTRASGALPHEKGDILHPQFHVECKHTIKASPVLRFDWWDLATVIADRDGKFPVLAIGWSPRGGPIFMWEEDGQPAQIWTTRNHTWHGPSPMQIEWLGVNFIASIRPPGAINGTK